MRHATTSTRDSLRGSGIPSPRTQPVTPRPSPSIRVSEWWRFRRSSRPRGNGETRREPGEENVPGRRRQHDHRSAKARQRLPRDPTPPRRDGISRRGGRSRRSRSGATHQVFESACGKKCVAPTYCARPRRTRLQLAESAEGTELVSTLRGRLHRRGALDGAGHVPRRRLPGDRLPQRPRSSASSADTPGNTSCVSFAPQPRRGAR